MGISIADFGGAPVVLAFEPAWRSGADSSQELDVIRSELRGLGAVLVVLSDEGIWSFRADDEFERFVSRDDEIKAAIADLAKKYAVERDRDGSILPTVIVVDGKGSIRFMHASASSSALRPTLAQALGEAGRALSTPTKSTLLLSRRELVLTSLVAGFALAFLGCGNRDASNHATPPNTDGGSVDDEIDVVLHVNGADRTVRIDPRVSLLDALRERMALTGTKKGCDHGQCGACTVLIDKRRVCSCLTLAIMAQKKEITTIEGLANGEQLHPMQEAFASQDGFQCGYCTPGQIMSAVGLLAEGHAQTDDEVREAMSGNICRCGAYPNIIAAVQLARKAG
jgi:xanthine dehydrogenase YagT iron-sulfur-binding subunit